MAQPEVYLSGADKLFGADGKLSSDGTRQFLEGFLQALLYNNLSWLLPPASDGYFP
jgi:hypothetical protein